MSNVYHLSDITEGDRRGNPILHVLQYVLPGLNVQNRTSPAGLELESALFDQVPVEENT